MRNDNAYSEEQKRKAGSSKYVFLCLSVFLFAAFVIQLGYFAVTTSATVDEPVHILAGYRHLKCGDFGINPEHPPMLKMIAAVPLTFREMTDAPWDCGSKMTGKNDSFLYGAKFVVQNGPDATVIPARVFASFAALALAVVVFAAAWKMFGRWEALLALALLAFEPNFIANGTLVTTDMTLSAAAIGAMFALYSYCRKPNWVTLAVAGIAFGILLAAKHSALIFAAAMLIVFVVDWFLYRRGETGLAKSVARQAGAFALVGLIGLTVLWSFYGFRYRSIPASVETTSVADYIAANGRPEMASSFSARIVEGIDRAHIFPESYVLGLADIVAMGNRNMFLFDSSYRTGQWFYFPVSFLIKTSIPLLLLLPFGVAFAFAALERRRELIFLLVPPFFFFAVAMTSGTNIGVRHILPVYPFFTIAAAAGAVWMARRFNGFRFVVVALLLFHVVTAARTAPDYMPFVNDFWGGTDNAYKIFRDPNLDFGQSHKFVAEYLEREGITDCWYASHGNTELTAAVQPCKMLPGTFGLTLTDDPGEVVPAVIEGTVLINSMGFMPRNDLYETIRQAEPVAVVGRAVFVYRGRFEVRLASAVSYAERSATLVRLKRLDEAFADGRKAVELAPEDPRTHLALGIALARSGSKDEAKIALEKSIETAKAKPLLMRSPEVRAAQELKRLEGN